MATETASAGPGAAYEEERRKRILDNLKHLEVRTHQNHDLSSIPPSLNLFPQLTSGVSRTIP
jgi:hypothetical protein